MTVRTHIARPDVTTITPQPRTQAKEPGYKPQGIWYEVDGDWRRWCSGEMPDWVAGRPLFSVTLGDERMLNLRNVEELDAFDAEWHVTSRHRGTFGLYDSCKGIRWADVAREYDGIEIAPYLWERRLDGHTWYYGWDCASGCIWRPKGVRFDHIGSVEGVDPHGDD